jgi:uroporphyrinogen-III synthase
MRVIVTRPQREAQRWVLDLSALGLDAVALPLIKVGPVDNPVDLLQAWQQLADYVGVMFVSGNAAEHFFASKPPLAPEFTTQAAIKTRAWATGPGTARALLRAGVAADRLDAPPLDAAQFDSEALWQVVGAQVQAGDRVLIVRGDDVAGSASAGQGTGREWFAERVARAGGRAEFVVAYQRGAPEFSADECQLARQAATDGSVWLFSSSEAVANLCVALPGQSWTEARALATHPRIALAARNAGFGVVCESRPTLPDVVASLSPTL